MTEEAEQARAKSGRGAAQRVALFVAAWGGALVFLSQYVWHPRWHPLEVLDENGLVHGSVTTLEKNAWRGLPGIDANLNGVKTTGQGEGQRIWVVGDSGLLAFVTPDGAIEQLQIEAPPEKTNGEGLPLRHHLTGLALDAEGNRGWAVGMGGVGVAIEKKEREGDDKLKSEKIAEPNVNFNAVACDTVCETVWAVGGKWVEFDSGSGKEGRLSGVIFRRGSSGWVEQALGEGTPELRAVSVSSGRVVAVGGGGAVVLGSTDGTQWQVTRLDSEPELFAMHFMEDGLRGWAVGRLGAVFATDDLGTSWQRQRLPEANSSAPHLRGVQFAPGGKKGWIVGWNGELFQSSSSGESWTQMDALSTGAEFYGVELSTERLWFVGSHGALVSMSLEGEWRPATTGDGLWLRDTTLAADGRRGWAVGRSETVLQTLDGGRNWRVRMSEQFRVIDDPKKELQSLRTVAFERAGRRGWALGSGQEVWTSENAGETWALAEWGGSDYDNFSSLELDEQGERVWASAQTTGGDKHLVSASIVGMNWRPSLDSKQAPLLGISAVAFPHQGSRGWAVGTEGHLYSSVDAGATWVRRVSGTTKNLTALAFSPSGEFGWLVGEGGTVLATRDGGLTWASQSIGTPANFSAVAVSSNGQRAWLIGESNAIWVTRNGGSSWTSNTIRRDDAKSSSARLSAISMSGDGLSGWVVGEAGQLGWTQNGGETWNSSEYSSSWPRYWWAFPLLFAILVVVAVGTLRAGWRRSRGGLVEKGNSDRPVAHPDEDRLGYAELARGLTDYLGHVETKGPLTIAVEAPWGRGKSSVLRMVEHLQRARGACPVWFNAWHHQQEKVLLAPLLESVRSQGLPPWYVWLGLRFRLRLLGLRVARRPVASVGLAVCFFVPGIVYVLWHQNSKLDFSEVLSNWQQFVAPLGTEWLQSLRNGELSKSAGSLLTSAFALPAVPLSLLFCAGLIGVGNALRAFPDPPAILLASFKGVFKKSEAKAANSFRERFRIHFGEVCIALAPHVPLIVIDDLDRCDPKATADTLEAINYLTTSGECFVLLGIARKVVEAQLVHHYGSTADAFEAVCTTDDAVAEKTIESEPSGRTGKPDPSVAPTLPTAQAHRVPYVRDYLRKLINLDVQLPAFSVGQAERLLGLKPSAANSELTPVVNSKEQVSPEIRSFLRRLARALDKVLRFGRLAAHRVPALLLVLAVGYAGSETHTEYEQVVKLRTTEVEAFQARNGKRLRVIRDLEFRVREDLKLAELAEKEARKRRNSHALLSDLSGKMEWEDASLSNLERRNALLGASGRAWFGQYCSRPGAVLETPVACWRLRQYVVRVADETVKEITALRERAEKAFTAVKPLAFSKEMTAVALYMPLSKSESRSNGKDGLSPKPGPVEGERASRVVGVRRLPTLPISGWWALPFVLLLAAVKLLEPVELKDSESFTSALKVWTPFLTQNRLKSVPRELKRFQNRARFYSLRLHAAYSKLGWLERRLVDSKFSTSRSKISDSDLVMLTALHHMDANISRVLRTYTNSSGQAVGPHMDALQAHFENFPDPVPSQDKIDAFLMVAEGAIDEEVEARPNKERRSPEASLRTSVAQSGVWNNDGTRQEGASEGSAKSSKGSHGNGGVDY